MTSSANKAAWNVEAVSGRNNLLRDKKVPKAKIIETDKKQTYGGDKGKALSNYIRGIALKNDKNLTDLAFVKAEFR